MTAIALKTLFVITISTTRFVFPGVPANESGSALEASARGIAFELAGDKVAGPDVTASVLAPAGLKIGTSVSLAIDPEAAKKAATSSAGIPSGSYASWPPPKAKALRKGASVVGSYTLSTNYCGGTSVELTKTQEFLPPIEPVILGGEVDLERSIDIAWKPVPNAVGYLVTARGGSQKRLITWTSSADAELSAGIETSPVTEDKRKELITKGALMAPETTSISIPAGYFKGARSAMLTITAFGRDLVQTRDGIETRVIVRSEASMPLASTPLVLPDR